MSPYRTPTYQDIPPKVCRLCQGILDVVTRGYVSVCKPCIRAVPTFLGESFTIFGVPFTRKDFWGNP